MNARSAIPACLIFPAVLFSAVFLAYANTLQAPFNYDDQAVILSNPEVQDHSYAQQTPTRYRHLFYLSLSLNHALGGLDPFGYHLFNLIVHSLTAWLVFASVFLLIRHGTGRGSAGAGFIASVTGLLFALNPVQSEAVTYISGRASGLAGFFYVLALLLFLWANLKSSSRFRPVLGVLFLASFFCAVLSKETSLTLPAAIVLVDLCFMKGEAWLPRRDRWRFFYAPLPVLGLLFLYLSPGLTEMIVTWMNKIDFHYALDQSRVWIYAVQLILFPVNLTFDYDFPETFFPAGLFRFWPLLLWSLLVGMLVRRFRRLDPVIPFGLFWFLITVAPTNSVLPRADLLSERNLYLPSLGWSLLVAAGAWALFRKSAAFGGLGRKTVAALVALLLVAQTALLIDRNAVYASNTRLWEDTLAKSPGNLRALHNLSHFYLAEKNYPQAFIALKKLAASRASPFYRSFAHSNLGSIYARSGDFARAERQFQKAIEADPTIPTGHLNLAALYASQGQHRRAKQEYEKADRGYRDYRWGYPRPPELDLDIAKVDFHLGSYEAAAAGVRSYLARHPDSGEGRLLLGRIYSALNQPEAAAEQYRRVRGSASLQARARIGLGVLAIEADQPDRALQEFEQAVALAPKWAEAHFNLGTLLLKTREDPERARRHLQAALTGTPDPKRRARIHQQLQRLQK